MEFPLFRPYYTHLWAKSQGVPFVSLLLIIDVLFQQPFALGDADAGDGIADDIQGGDEHLSPLRGAG